MSVVEDALRLQKCSETNEKCQGIGDAEQPEAQREETDRKLKRRKEGKLKQKIETEADREICKNVKQDKFKGKTKCRENVYRK